MKCVKNFSETSDKFTLHFQIIYLKLCTKTGGRARGRWREGRLVESIGKKRR